MKFVETPLAGVIRIEPTVHRDDRGHFFEVFHAGKFAAAGIDATFVQDNQSSSGHGVLRGLHLQTIRPQGKLVRCLSGAVFDVAVDVRRGSPQFGRWYGVELSGENGCSLWVPPGFAHGFVVTSERAEVEYKCTDLYHPQGELSVRWDDPEIGIEWPVATPRLSAKDAAAPTLAEAADRLPLWAP
jgi:dTDP-4-dehydrorhamnose 3,5-epimerase